MYWNCHGPARIAVEVFRPFRLRRRFVERLDVGYPLARGEHAGLDRLLIDPFLVDAEHVDHDQFETRRHPLAVAQFPHRLVGVLDHVALDDAAGRAMAVGVDAFDFIGEAVEPVNRRGVVRASCFFSALSLLIFSPDDLPASPGVMEFD